VFRRLEHNRITRSQGRSDFHRRQEHLAVPWHNGCDHTERFAVCEHKHVGLVDGQGFTMHLVGGTCVEMQKLRDVFRLPSCFREHLARISRFNPTNMFGIFSQQIGQTAKRLTTLCRRHLAPRAIKRGMSGLHGGIHVLRCRLWHGGPDRAGCWVHTVKPRAIGCIDPSPTDQHLIVCHFGHLVPTLRFTRKTRQEFRFGKTKYFAYIIRKR